MNHFSLFAIMIVLVLCRSCESNQNLGVYKCSGCVICRIDLTPESPVLWLLKSHTPFHICVLWWRWDCISSCGWALYNYLLSAHGQVMSFCINHHLLHKEMFWPSKTIQACFASHSCLPRVNGSDLLLKTSLI